MELADGRQYIVGLQSFTVGGCGDTGGREQLFGLIKNNNKRLQIPGFSAGFSRVTYSLDWINTVIQNNPACTPGDDTGPSEWQWRGLWFICVNKWSYSFIFLNSAKH